MGLNGAVAMRELRSPLLHRSSAESIFIAIFMHADTRHNPASAPTATQVVEWVGGGLPTLHDS